MKGFLIIGLIIASILLDVPVIAEIPMKPIPKQQLDRAKQSQDIKRIAPRKDVSFEVKGTRLSAWLYLPEDLSSPAPCIVMTHGFGGTKDFLLERYAVRFAEAGFAVLTFDYRFFGESEGEPRQFLSIPHQLEDLAAAVAYARSLEEVDPDRIALWGSSAGGGYGITIAAKDHRIACVVSHVPGLDPHAAVNALLKREGLGWLLRLLAHGLLDMVREWLGMTPHRIPIVGRPGSVAVLTTPEAYDFITKQAPKSFVNEVCARVFAPNGDDYRPIEHARDVRCPVLLQLADKDNLAPPIGGEKTAKILGELAVIKRYPIGHFDIYLGDWFEKAVSDQLAFFKQHLQAPRQ